MKRTNVSHRPNTNYLPAKDVDMNFSFLSQEAQKNGVRIITHGLIFNLEKILTPDPRYASTSLCYRPPNIKSSFKLQPSATSAFKPIDNGVEKH